MGTSTGNTAKVNIAVYFCLTNRKAVFMIKSNLRTSLTRGGFVAASVLAGSMLLCGTGCSSDAQMLNSWGM